MRTEYKVNLGPEDLPGYWNTDDLLLQSVETNQCTELLVDLFLGRVPVDKVQEVIKHWVTRLRKGSKLIINDLDIQQLAKAVLSKKTPVQEINRLLYNGRVSCLTLDNIISILQSLGLRILRKSLVEFEYSVEAIRD